MMNSLLSKLSSLWGGGVGVLWVSPLGVGVCVCTCVHVNGLFT